MFSLRVQLGAEFLDDWIGGRQPCMRHPILEAALFQREQPLGRARGKTGISSLEELLDLWREFDPAPI
jgi:hypothetical protein